MLKTMRSNIKSLSWTLWLVILAFVGFIFMQWGSGREISGGGDSTLLKVGKQAIRGEVYEQQLLQTLNNYSRQLKNNFNKNLIMQLGIPEQVLQNLINTTLILNEARRYGLSVSDAELKSKIRNYPAFQRDGKFIGGEEYERLLAYNQIKVKEFEDGLREEAMIDKVKNLVADTAILDERQLRQEYQKENDKVDLDYVVFNLDEIKQEFDPSPKELEDYYQQHRSTFKTPEKRLGYLVTVKFADVKNMVKISDKELYEYYKNNKDVFKVPGKTRLSRIYLKYSASDRESILARVEALTRELNRDNFGQKARELSEDDKAKEGGDWGYWNWQSLSNQEQTMIERMAENEVSPPVDTGEGFAVLFIPEKVPETQQTYEEVKAKIREIVENDQLRKAAATQMEKVWNKIKDQKDLKKESAKSGRTVIETQALSNGQPIPGVDESGTISQKLFTLSEKEISPPFDLADGVAVIQLAKVMKSAVAPFAEVHDRVRDEVIREMKLAILQKNAQDTTDQLNQMTDSKKIEDLLKAKNLKPVSHEYHRGNRLAELPILKNLDQMVFSLAEGIYSPPLKFDRQVAIIKVKSKKITSDADFEKNRTTYYQQKIGEQENRLFASYLLNKRSQSPIKFNNSLYEKIKNGIIARFR